LAADRVPERLARGEVPEALADIDRVIEDAVQTAQSGGMTADTSRALNLASIARARVLTQASRTAEAEATLRRAHALLSTWHAAGTANEPERLAVMLELASLGTISCGDPVLSEFVDFPLHDPATWGLALQAVQALDSSGCTAEARTVQARLQAAIPADLAEVRARVEGTAGTRIR
jgi:hypothetical protein